MRTLSSLLFLCAVAVPLSLYAGTVIVTEVSFDGEFTTQETTYLNDELVKFVSDEQIVVLDLRQGLVSLAFPQERICWSGSLDEFARGMNSAGADMYESETGSGRVDVRRVQRTATIAGAPASQYDIVFNGEKAEELWIATDPAVAGGTDLAKLAAAMVKLQAGLQTSYAIGGIYESSSDYMALRGQGYLVRAMASFGPGIYIKSEVKSIRRAELSANDFELPSQCRKVGMQELGRSIFMAEGDVYGADGGWDDSGAPGYGDDEWGDTYGGQGNTGQDNAGPGNMGAGSGGYEDWGGAYQGSGEGGSGSTGAAGAGYEDWGGAYQGAEKAGPGAVGSGASGDDDWGGAYQGSGGSEGENYGQWGASYEDGSPAGQQPGNATQWGGGGSAGAMGGGGSAGVFRSPQGPAQLRYGPRWVPRVIEGEGSNVYVLQDSRHFDSLLLVTAEIFPAAPSQFTQGVWQQLPAIFPGATPTGAAKNAKCCGGAGNVTAQYQDFRFGSQGYQGLGRLYVAHTPHVAVALIGRSDAASFQAALTDFDAMFQSLEIFPVDRAVMQSLVGHWSGISQHKSLQFYGADGSPLPGTGGSSTEHTLNFHPDGTCASSSFGSVSGMTDGSSPMAGYGSHSVGATMGSGSGSGGRYFVAGGCVYVASQREFYVIEMPAPGTLQQGTVRYVRQ